MEFLQPPEPQNCKLPFPRITAEINPELTTNIRSGNVKPGSTFILISKQKFTITFTGKPHTKQGNNLVPADVIQGFCR